MKVQHIKLDHCKHFLVVDGVRGPLSEYGPAHHPEGVVAYLPDDPGAHREVRGKVFRQLDSADVEFIEDMTCEPAEAALKAWMQVSRACIEVKLARYGESAEPKEAK